MRSLSLLAIVSVVVGCRAGSVINPEPTSYRGVLTGPKEVAVIDLVIGPTTTTTSTASGTLTWLSMPTATTISGTYDVRSGTLLVHASLDDATDEGSDATVYALMGVGTGGPIDGVFDSTGGSGNFSLGKSENAAPATLYCGNALGSEGEDVGYWNFVVDAYGTASGVQCARTNCGVIKGQLSGTTLTLTDRTGLRTNIQGTVTGDTAQGTWESDEGSGTWTTTTQGCQPESVASEEEPASLPRAQEEAEPMPEPQAAHLARPEVQRPRVDHRRP